MKAQAVVVREPNRVALETVTMPDPTDDDVVVRVTHSWISPGTEGSFVRGERLDGETARTPTDPLPFLLVPGYQKVGVAEWVGANVHDIAIGDTVFAAMSYVDGVLFGFGGHVSPAVTPRSGIWAVPNYIDPVAFSGLVLTQVGYNYCGMRPTVMPGDVAVVIGDGLVGHWAAQTLAHRGAQVMLAGRHNQRLEHFSAPGCQLINSTQIDLRAAAAERAKQGIQVLIDTVDSVATIEQLLPDMRHDGHIVSAGFHGSNGTIDIQRLRGRELTLHAPSGWRGQRMEATRTLIAQGALQTIPLITHHFPITAAAEAFDIALNDRRSLGVILDWQ